MVLDDKRPALTQRQQDIYDFLRDKILNRGYGPTVREIGNHFGIRSPNGVMCHLKALEKKGLITRESHMSRAIQLAESPQERLTLPYAGLLTDGEKLAEPATEERVDFGDLFDTESHCIIRVAANYDTVNIVSGDCLVVNRTNAAGDGDIVVGLDDLGNATICRYHAGGSRLEPLGVPGILSGRNRVVGVVASVIRRMGS